MRKMVTIREISDINPIKDADAIELASVDGWNVVVRKGEFEIGQKVYYFEIDSCLPTKLERFEFLAARGEKKVIHEEQEKRVHVLKTIKLRGQISQGLIQPVADEPIADKEIGEDVSEWFGVFKYEPPIPANLAGVCKSTFPSFVKKTDEERVQNLSKNLEDWKGEKFVVTEKLDGTSFTAYLNEGEFGVCSRNMDLERSEDNTYWKYAIENNIEKKMRSFKGMKNFAIQGELVGEGIQKNRYKIKGHQVFFFTMFSIDGFHPLCHSDAERYFKQMQLPTVPFLKYLILDHTVDDLLEEAKILSTLQKTQAEGIVIRKKEDGTISFKAINNNFLLKEKG